MNTSLTNPLNLLWAGLTPEMPETFEARERFLQFCTGMIRRFPSAAVRHEAALRLAAWAADRHGLRELWRLDEEQDLGADPLRESRGESADLVLHLLLTERRSPAFIALDATLSATAALARTLQEHGAARGDWAAARPPHPLGYAPGDGSRHCSQCAWFVPFRGKSSGSCQYARLEKIRRQIPATTPACRRFEFPFGDEACGTCGACCHRGFSLVPVLPGDVTRKLHPEWIEKGPWGFFIPRPRGQCLALTGNGRDQQWRCRDYLNRPRHCRDFTSGSLTCLEARRRAGIPPVVTTIQR